MEVQRKLKKLPLHSLPHRKPWLLNRNLKGDLILVPQDFCLEWVGGGGGGGGKGGLFERKFYTDLSLKSFL